MIYSVIHSLSIIAGVWLLRLERQDHEGRL